VGKTFKLEVVTPEETALSAEVSAIQAPAWEGYLGVMAGHAPLLAVLRPGVLTVKDAAGVASYFAIRGGFMEVTPERTIILADDIEKATDVDPAAAERQLDELTKAPPPATGENMEQRRVRNELAQQERADARSWAEARLRAADLQRGGTAA
jgi:F-type H+-transporting ATPase subunit epsilon